MSLNFDIGLITPRFAQIKILLVEQSTLILIVILLLKNSLFLNFLSFFILYSFFPYNFNFSYAAETEQGVAQAIIRSVIDFKRDPWPKVSDNAKDLVKKMLNPDPKQRLSAQEVLGTLLLVSVLYNFTFVRLY